MSAMCSMKGCTQKGSLCSHEKMMLAVMILAGLGAMGHWMFQWF